MINLDDRFEYLWRAGVPDDDVERFIARFREGKVAKRLDLSGDGGGDDVDEVREVVTMLGLDGEKFGCLVNFLYDYTADVCFNGVEVEEGGHEMMWMLIERGSKLINGLPTEPLKTDASCTFRIQGRSYRINDLDSIAILLYWIHRGMIHMSDEHPIWELNWLIDDYEQHTRERKGSSSSTRTGRYPPAAPSMAHLPKTTRCL